MVTPELLRACLRNRRWNSNSKSFHGKARGKQALILLGDALCRSVAQSTPSLLRPPLTHLLRRYRRDISPESDKSIIRMIKEHGEGFDRPEDRDEVVLSYTARMSGSDVVVASDDKAVFVVGRGWVPQSRCPAAACLLDARASIIVFAHVLRNGISCSHSDQLWLPVHVARHSVTSAVTCAPSFPPQSLLPRDSIDGATHVATGVVPSGGQDSALLWGCWWDHRCRCSFDSFSL